MSPEERIIERLRNSLASVIAVTSYVGFRCEHLHHTKKERHASGDPCPVERRLIAEIALAREELHRP